MAAQALTPVEIMAPATREDAEKAASLLLVLQQMEKELAARLKAWVQECGPVAVGDLVYGPQPYPTYNLDPQAVVEALLEAGLSRGTSLAPVERQQNDPGTGSEKLKQKALWKTILNNAPCKTTERYEFRKEVAP